MSDNERQKKSWVMQVRQPDGKYWGRSSFQFNSDEKQKNDHNFQQTLKSIKKSVHMWKWRNLSILGKIQLVKTFATPKLLF